MLYPYCIKHRVCQDKNFISGMHGKIGDYIEDTDLSLHGSSDTGPSSRNT